jgi:hypothetical protein
MPIDADAFHVEVRMDSHYIVTEIPIGELSSDTFTSQVCVRIQPASKLKLHELAESSATC